MQVTFQPRALKLAEAQRFVLEHHRHTAPLKRHKFSIGIDVAFHRSDRHKGSIWNPRIQILAGVVSVDQASSAWSSRDDLLEIRRVCVGLDPMLKSEGVTEKHLKNAASKLLGRASRAIFDLGYTWAITYSKPHESGSSLKAAGFEMAHYEVHRYSDGSVDGRLRWEKVSPDYPELKCYGANGARDLFREVTDQCLNEVEEFSRKVS
jgi:hypothetical protein